MLPSLDFLNVSFCYDTLAGDLLADLTARFPTGWTGIVGANGAGKTTLLRLAVGELEPQRGRVIRPRQTAYCAQRTDDPPPALAALLAACDGETLALRGRLALGDDWVERWATLSHGERKRAQLAAALWRRPAVLAVDEPTNHLDAAARGLLERALRAFDGIGLLVSHDRDLLDGLCAQCLFLAPPRAVMRPGGYSSGAAQTEREDQHARAVRQKAVREQKRVEAEMARRRAAAAREHHVRSKRGLARHDSDGRARIDAARVADSKAGAPLRQLEGRAAQAAQRVAAVQVAKVVEHGIWLDDARAAADTVARVAGGTLALVPAGGAIAATPARRLHFPDLALTPTARVALTGPNGAGKSTLVEHLVRHATVTPDRLLYLPQETTAERARAVIGEVRGLSHAQLGRVLQIISRLGSEPRRLLETELPSPGETRKLLLALGVLRSAHLVILDEPTNHLDLPSITCVEGALREYPGALLLVSHDERFLRALTRERWQLECPAADADSHLAVRHTL
jgi:macrolide transport system ATP-binding/permease protein